MRQASEMQEALLCAERIHPLGGHPPVRALLLRHGRVAALGSEAEVRAMASPGARVVRLEGATVTPGLTDAHIHPTAWALAARRVDLSGAASVQETLDRVRSAAGDGDGWLLGQGWHQQRLGRLPERGDLDAVVPHRPVLLESHDIHAAWLNSEALRRCGITRDTPDPPGGELVRDPATGEPTGVLREEAKKLALAHVPPPGRAEVTGALRAAQGRLHRFGITGIHSVEPTGLEDLEPLLRGDELRLRVLHYLPLDGLDEAIRRGLRSGMPFGAGVDARGAEWIRIGGVKMFLDGALGSCTAWMREPYCGSAENRGIQTLPGSDFRDAARRAADAGLSTAVHAIGDAAVDLALRVLGEETPPPAALPHRIEHLQLCPPEWWERAGRSGVVASMQPVHLLTDIPAAERHWGHERCRGAFAFAPLLRAGARLAFGSDAPVETPDPRPGLFAAVRRESWEGPWRGGEWYADLAIGAADALAAYTEGPAYAAGQADHRGRLLPGYDADLVAWDRDPLTVSPEELRAMRCILTMVGGEIVYGEGGA